MFGKVDTLETYHLVMDSDDEEALAVLLEEEAEADV